LINKKSLLKKQFALGRFDFFEYATPPKSMSATCQMEQWQINGRNVFSLAPKNKTADIHILYLHGGAYVQGFVRLHWQFLSSLVSHLHCSIIAPDYPLAPNNTYKESFAMVDVLYKELISTIHSKQLILMGESAGGGFALALAQKMSYEGIEQPSQILLLSPWLDISLSNPDIKYIEPRDPFLGIEGLKLAGEAYAGGTSLDHYLLSPIYGPLQGLGKISLFIGTKEILLADARKLKALAASQGIEINYYEYEDMVHVWMFLNLPESKKARQQIMELIKDT
jgi:acetyl esterase/lipase